ncbi:MAG: succinylglutamate desuccinylase [Synergistaceae bacterium]|jgi:predicted deacylase|nr:succinylglutamate desuccinylase [Synergistaceae bacterium]
MDKTNKIKAGALLVSIVLAAAGGAEFYAMRGYKEAMVLGPSVVEVRKLSQYEPSLAGTANDANIYILDSSVPGGTVMILGGTHPEEPVGPIAAHILVENARLEAGRLVVVSRANRSGSLYSRNGEAYPNYFHVETEWGEKKWRLGDRAASPLDSWPDPEVYVHYPSRQMLAYMDIRNLNRAWPGRPQGLLVERTTHGLMEFIRREKVDMLIDLHEAELEYPVENTIVAHENGQEIAAMASMMLTAQEFPVPIGVEFSPKALHGLTHREVGDHSDARSLLFEVAEPMLDRIRGVTDERLLMEGKDEFVMEAGKHKLLYAPMDENGWPIEVRVGRHLSTILQCIDVFNMMIPDRPVTVAGIPRYAEVVEKKLGYLFRDPSKAPADKVAYD